MPIDKRDIQWDAPTATEEIDPTGISWDEPSASAANISTDEIQWDAPEPEPAGALDIVTALPRGAYQGVVRGLPEMVGKATQFVGSYLPEGMAEPVQDFGKSVSESSLVKGRLSPEELQQEKTDAAARTGAENVLFEAGSMLGPSILPGGALTGAARVGLGVSKAVKAGEMALAATKATRALNIGAGGAAGLFGLSQAQSTREGALERSAALEAEGKTAEAQQMKEKAFGLAPIATGAIEAAGEFFGTKYLGKIFGVDKAEKLAALGIGGKWWKDLLRTAGVEVGTEIGQQVGEAGVEKYSGIRPEADLLAEGKSVILPTLILTAMTGGLAKLSGAAARRLEKKQASPQGADLSLNEQASRGINDLLKTPPPPVSSQEDQDLLDLAAATLDGLEGRDVNEWTDADRGMHEVLSALPEGDAAAVRSALPGYVEIVKAARAKEAAEAPAADQGAISVGLDTGAAGPGRTKAEREAPAGTWSAPAIPIDKPVDLTGKSQPAAIPAVPVGPVEPASGAAPIAPPAVTATPIPTDEAVDLLQPAEKVGPEAVLPFFEQSLTNRGIVPPAAPVVPPAAPAPRQGALDLRPPVSQPLPAPAPAGPALNLGQVTLPKSAPTVEMVKKGDLEVFRGLPEGTQDRPGGTTYFTTDKSFAETFHQGYAGTGKAEVRSETLSGKNIWDFRQPEDIKALEGVVPPNEMASLKRGDWGTVERYQAAIRSAGFDGFSMVESGALNVGVFNEERGGVPIGQETEVLGRGTGQPLSGVDMAGGKVPPPAASPAIPVGERRSSSNQERRDTVDWLLAHGRASGKTYRISELMNLQFPQLQQLRVTEEALMAEETAKEKAKMTARTQAQKPAKLKEPVEEPTPEAPAPAAAKEPSALEKKKTDRSGPAWARLREEAKLVGIDAGFIEDPKNSYEGAKKIVRDASAKKITIDRETIDRVKRENPKAWAKEISGMRDLSPEELDSDYYASQIATFIMKDTTGKPAEVPKEKPYGPEKTAKGTKEKKPKKYGPLKKEAPPVPLKMTEAEKVLRTLGLQEGLMTDAQVAKRAADPENPNQKWWANAAKARGLSVQEEKLPGATVAPEVPVGKVAPKVPQRSVKGDLLDEAGRRDEQAQVELIPEEKKRPSILEESGQEPAEEEFPVGMMLAPTERTLFSKGGVVVDRRLFFPEDPHPKGGVVIQLANGTEKHLTLKEARGLEKFTESDLRLIEKQQAKAESLRMGVRSSLIGKIKSLGGYDPNVMRPGEKRKAARDKMLNLQPPPGVWMIGKKDAGDMANQLGYRDGDAMEDALRRELETGEFQFPPIDDEAAGELFQPKEAQYGPVRNLAGRKDTPVAAGEPARGGAGTREGFGSRHRLAVVALKSTLRSTPGLSEKAQEKINKIAPAHPPISRQAEAEITALMAKIVGKSKSVFFVDSNGMFNGVKAVGNNVFVDVNADNPLFKVFAHEFLHADNDIYQRILLDAVWNTVDRKKFKEWRDKRDSLQAAGGLPKLSEAAAIEEFSADFLAGQMSDPAFWERLSKEHRGLFKRLATWIHEKLVALGVKVDPLGEYFTEPGAMAEAVRAAEDFVRARMENVPGVTGKDLAFMVRAALLPSQGAVSTVADEEGNTPPAMSEMLMASEYWNKIFSDYIREGETKSSREIPATSHGLTVGMWRYEDRYKGVYGHDVAQLRLLDPNTLLLGEDVDSNGRRPDADRYAKWFKEGKAAPPIEVLETDKGLMRVTDGHRRVASAKTNNVPILAWVSPSMDVPAGESGRLPRYNGDPSKPVIKTGIAYEMWKDGTAKRTTPLEGGFSAPGLPAPPDFPMFSPREQPPYTPDWAAIAAGQDVAHQMALRRTWISSQSGKLDDALRVWQDRNVDMLRTRQDIERSMGALNDEVNFRQKETLAISKVADRQSELKKQFEIPILELMALNNESIESVGEYLSNRHAEEYNDVIARRNPRFEGPGSGIATEDAQAYLEGLSPERRAGLEAIEEVIRAYSTSVEDMMVEYGLENQETLDLWREMYPHYVPFQREGADEGEGPGNRTGKGMNIRGGESKVAHGSSLPITNVLANLFEKGRRTIMRGEKNRVGNAAYGAAVKYQNKDFWKAVNPERVSKRRFAALEAERAAIQEEIDAQGQVDLLEEEGPFTADSLKLAAKMDKVEKAIEIWHANRAELISEMAKLGVPAADVAEIFDEPKERYLNPYTKQTAWRVNSAVRDKPYVLATRFKGQDHFLFFNNRNPRALEMAKAMKNMDVEDLHFMLSAMSKYTRVFASLSTQWNVFFGPTNATRDVQEAMLNLTNTPLAGRQADVLKMVPKAIMGIYKDVRTRRAGEDADLNNPVVRSAEEYRKNGGMTGFVTMLADAQERAETLEKEFKKITEGKLKSTGRAIFDWISDYNEALENGTRLAVYMVGRENGMSPEQSATLAKEITINFNRKGQIASQAGAMYAFFNAAVQGSAIMAKTLAGPAGKMILAGGLAFGVMQALALAAAGYKDDEPPDFVKQRNIIIPWGDKDKNYTMIPLPLGFAIIPSLGRMMTEQIIGGGKGAGKLATNLLGLMADTFIPTGSGGNPSSLAKFAVNTITPTVGRPVAALAMNEDYTGRPVFQENYSFRERSPGYTRTKDSASALGKIVAKAANFATGGTQNTPGTFSPTPDEIDFLVSQYAGGVGRETAKIAATATAVAKGEEILPYKVPLAGRFWGSAAGSYAVKNRFYENLRVAYEHKNEIEGLALRGENVAAYIKKNPIAPAFKMAMSFEGKIKKLKEAKEAMNSRGFHAHDKSLDQQIVSMMDMFNKQIDQLRKKE